MNNLLPEYLYRGDSQQGNNRNIVSSWPAGYLTTNMAHGGNASEIFNKAFIELVERHIELGWDLTHFLSFSEKTKVARKFASGKENRELLQPAGLRWDAAIFTLDTSRLSQVDSPEIGIYHAIFQRRFDSDDPLYGIHERFLSEQKSPQQPEMVSIYLIDVVSYLRAQIGCRVSSSLNSALEKACLNKEWLVLPTDPPANNRVHGLTGIIKPGCISHC